MHAIVAIKQVPDTSNVRINPETGTLIRTWLLPNRLSIKTAGCSGCGARCCVGRTSA